MYQPYELLGAIEHQMRIAHASEKAAQSAALAETLDERAANKRAKRRRQPLFVRWQVAA